MTIPIMDMAAQHRPLQAEIEAALHQVIEEGHFILGPNVAALETEIAAYLGVEHGVGVASGTDALVLALRALEIGAGDEVIVPTYTFFATAEAVLLVGATPVFVDCELQTYCFDVAQIEAKITPHTKAIIAVHLYGQAAEMKPLLELAQAHGLKVIEDNAQAFGAEYEGQKTGSLGDIGCLSFFPSKNLGALGDGGMVVSNDAEVAAKVKMLRTHGWRKKYFPEVVGYNSRLDEMQAAVLRIKLPHVKAWNQRRRDIAQRYNDELESLDIDLPQPAANTLHAFHLYIVRVKHRDEVERALKERGVASAVYYPVPLHLTQPCQQMGCEKGSFPVAERASEETLALPLYPEMTDEQIETVVKAVKQAVGN